MSPIYTVAGVGRSNPVEFVQDHRDEDIAGRRQGEDQVFRRSRWRRREGTQKVEVERMPHGIGRAPVTPVLTRPLPAGARGPAGARLGRRG